MSERFLFTRTGILQSAPSDFYPALASTYDAVTVSTKDIKNKGSANVEYRTRETRSRLEDAFSDNRNIYFEKYVNTVGRRQEIRDIAARFDDVHVVHLAMLTPLKLITKRILDEHGITPDQALNRAVKRDFSIVQSMDRRIMWLRSYEPGVNLRGTIPTPALLSQVDTYVGKL